MAAVGQKRTFVASCLMRRIRLTAVARPYP